MQRQPASGETRRFRLTRSMRLTRKQDLLRLFRTGDRFVAGPIVLFARPNDLMFPRLGLAIPRAAGGAIRRNRIRRLLREAFRLAQYETTTGYDLVIRVRPHQPLALNEYEDMLNKAITAFRSRWN